MKKISIITGVAGTIGSNLAKKLIKKNHIVYGIDNFSLGKRNNLKNILNKKNFKLIKCDLSKTEELNKFKILFNKKIDYLWLLAANSDIKAGIKNPLIDQNNTFLSTTNSVNFFYKKIKNKGKIFFSSSSAVYGNKKNILNETQKNYFPISNYGENKLLSEIFVSKFCKRHKIDYLITRFPNVVGKPFTHGVIFDLVNKLKKNKILKVLGNGSQQKPYVHVSELIESIIYLMMKKTTHHLYLLGPNDNGINVKKIVQLIKKLFNSKKKTTYQKNNFGWVGDVPRYSYNVQRINKEGFKFKNSSYDSIKLAIKERYYNIN